jgi:hypothetical protein
LEIGILGPIPVLAGQLFAAINCSIYFALQKYKLPKAGFCQIAFRGFHFVSHFSPSSISPTRPLKMALSNPSGNANAIGQLAAFRTVFGAYG